MFYYLLSLYTTLYIHVYVVPSLSMFMYRLLCPCLCSVFFVHVHVVSCFILIYLVGA